MPRFKPICKVVPQGCWWWGVDLVGSIDFAYPGLVKDPIITAFDAVEHIRDLLLTREYLRVKQAPHDLLEATIIDIELSQASDLCGSVLARLLCLLYRDCGQGCLGIC